jgi:hypothetical protein
MTGDTEHDLDGTPLPKGWQPSIAEQEAYWAHLPEYECPKCGEWFKVGTIEDELDCSCGAHLHVSRDGEFRDGTWHDLTRLVPQQP